MNLNPMQLQPSLRDPQARGYRPKRVWAKGLPIYVSRHGRSPKLWPRELQHPILRGHLTASYLCGINSFFIC